MVSRGVGQRKCLRPGCLAASGEPSSCERAVRSGVRSGVEAVRFKKRACVIFVVSRTPASEMAQGDSQPSSLACKNRRDPNMDAAVAFNVFNARGVPAVRPWKVASSRQQGAGFCTPVVHGGEGAAPQRGREGRMRSSPFPLPLELGDGSLLQAYFVRTERVSAKPCAARPGRGAFRAGRRLRNRRSVRRASAVPDSND